MRIRELHLIRYGKFTERRIELPQQPRDIHLIIGPNEAGKSTVRTAIRDWLFGIPMRTPLAFVHPMPELRIGGVIERGIPGSPGMQALAFERAKGNRNTLRAPDDAVLPDATLHEWIGALDAEAFGRMHALDHATLVAGGAGLLSASDDLGRMLFQSAAGIEHLGRVMKALEDEAGELWAPRKSGARAYYVAHDAFEQAREQLKAAVLRTRDWKSQHAALLETGEALAAARGRHAQLRAELNVLERVRRVRPMLAALDGAHTRHRELLAAGDVPLLPENACQINNETNRDLAVALAALDRHEKDIARAHAELGRIPVDLPVLSAAADIDELNAQRLQFRQHRDDIAKRTEEIRLEWQHARELAAGLGWSVADEAALRRRLPTLGVRTRLARLIKERGALADRMESARRSLGTQHRDLETTRASLEALPPDTVSAALAVAVEQAQMLGDPAGALAALDARIAQADADLDSASQALGAWRADPASLRAMVAPEIATIRSLLDGERADRADARSQENALTAREAEQQRLELELNQLIRAFRPVSREQVDEARRQRDEDWQAIRNAPQALPARAPGYEARVAQADALADARLERAQHDADREARTARLEAHRLETRALQLRLDTLQQRIAQRTREWQEICDACGLPGLPLDAAPAWLAQRERVLGQAQECDAARRARAALLESAEAARRGLWAALGEAAAPEAMASLTSLLRRARDRIEQAGEARGRRLALDKQLLDGQAALAALEASAAAAAEAWRQWETSWIDASRDAGYDASVLADRVAADIETMEEIARRLARIESIRVERIETMQADLDRLAAGARTLALRLAPELAGSTAEEVATTLVERLAQARQARATRDDWQTRLAAAEKALADTVESKSAVERRLRPLLAAAGVSDTEALGPAIERSDRRRAIENDIARAQADLDANADGFALDQLRDEVARVDPIALPGEFERLNTEAETVVEQIAALGDRHGTQKKDFEAFDGADQGARAEARRQEAIAAMADAAERYLRLRTAARLLKWSMEKFRETRQGPMLARASTVFSALTLGSFSRLLVDGEGQSPRLFGVRPEGAQVDVSGMSEGSRDQLYLALRLAALEMQADQGAGMPLIADDLFINFDDDRTAAGLQVLGELSTRAQVVFLTHHVHLVPLARDVLGERLNIVML